MLSSKYYDIYHGETRTAVSVPEERLEATVSHVRNCWPQESVFVYLLQYHLIDVRAPKCKPEDAACIAEAEAESRKETASDTETN